MMGECENVKLLLVGIANFAFWMMKYVTALLPKETLVCFIGKNKNKSKCISGQSDVGMKKHL